MKNKKENNKEVSIPAEFIIEAILDAMGATPEEREFYYSLQEKPIKEAWDLASEWGQDND